MDYSIAFEKHDYGRIDKLNRLTNPNTFWDDVRKLCSNVHSDHAIHRWEHLAELRFEEINSTMRV